MYGCSKDCLILIPFRLPQVSCFTLSLKCFSYDSDNCPDVGIRPLLWFPHLLRAGPVLLTLLFFPSSSFILPSFVWLYIFFSAGQVLLSALSWCSACTSVSDGVFLMYRGQRCTPRPPTPLPSCSLFKIRTFNKFSTSLRPYYILLNLFFFLDVLQIVPCLIICSFHTIILSMQ